MSRPDPIRLEELRGVDDLAGLPDDELSWLAAEAQALEFEVGASPFHPGSPVDDFYIVIRGVIEMMRTDPELELRSLLVRHGEITGRLPFSRMRVFPGHSAALEPVRVATFPSERVHDLAEHAPQTLARLVHLMLDRTRRFSRAGAQREKLVGLGTMAAGLAHELNNPASAARRSADELDATLADFARLATDLVGESVFADGVGAGGEYGQGERTPIATLRSKAARALDEGLDPLERSDLEDDLGEWLEALGTPDPWDAAAVLVTAGYRRDDLASALDRLEPRRRTTLLAWLAKGAALLQLGADLAEATGRISTLVAAMKSYSYMDQSEDRAPVDIAKGIRDTVTILGHRLRDRNVVLHDELPELPSVLGFGSELNQVWTNLIDNASAAAGEGGGTVTIRGEHHAPSGAVVVEICDNGPGVPPELRARIFEPFFTTKGVGEGTGMGLDIAKRIVEERHHGSLDLESEPGDTRFRVWLPVEGGPST